MIYIDKFEKIFEDSWVKYSCFLVEDGIKEVLWFSFPCKFDEFFCADRVDGIIVMLLYHFLKKGKTVSSHIPISETLYYQLTHSLIPVLVNHSQGSFKRFQIECPFYSISFGKNDKVAATGISCGVDSLFAVYEHSVMDCPENFRVKLLTYFNNGSFNGEYKFSQSQIREGFFETAKNSERFADDQEMKFLVVDSNLDEIVDSFYGQDHTFRTVGMAMMFQKLIEVYYYANGHKIDNFNINTEMSCGLFDIYSLPMLSTESFRAYSQATPYTRIDKIKYLSTYEPSYNYLQVCVNGSHNCSKCNKCIRTMITLDILGKLNKYEKVFDIKKYMNIRSKRLAEMMVARFYDEYARENYFLAKAKNVVWPKETILRFLFLFLWKSVKKFFPDTFKIRIKNFAQRIV
jgi:hypothetical protein